MTASTARSRGQLGTDESEHRARARKTYADNRMARARKAGPAPEAAEYAAPIVEVDVGDGWGPARNGRQRCRCCKGEGIDRRPGPGAGICCLNCLGEGYRWQDPPAENPAAAPARRKPGRPRKGT